jgi:hypothetical protein
MAGLSIERCIVAAACLVATAATAQGPTAPAGIIYMATTFCPKQTKSVYPRHTFVKIWGGVLPDPLPVGLAEAEKDGHHLLPCEPRSSAGARRDRLMSEIIAHYASGAAADCPGGSVAADGRTIQINSDPAMFSLLGTNYGGDGKTSFKLPDLRLKPGAVVRQAGGTLRFCIVTQGTFPS